jgi:Predicted metal-dependent membrane protease
MPIASFLSQVGSLFFKNIVSEVMNQISNTPLLMQLGIVALVPAMCEEMTMRGIVLSGYEKIGRGKAAVVTGLFFGILHMNPQQFLYPFALGILFAYLVRITNSIFSTMLCHFVFNGTQVTLSYLALRANPNALQAASNSLATMSFQDKIISLLQLLLWSLICIWIIVIILKKMDKRHNIVSTSQIDIDKNNTESNEEIEYLLKDIREEKVVNFPFILVICVYIIFTLLGLYYFKKF